MTDRRQVLQVAVLAAAGVLVLPACSTDDPAPDVSATPNPQVSVGAVAADHVIAAVEVTGDIDRVLTFAVGMRPDRPLGIHVQHHRRKGPDTIAIQPVGQRPDGPRVAIRIDEELINIDGQRPVPMTIAHQKPVHPVGAKTCRLITICGVPQRYVGLAGQIFAAAVVRPVVHDQEMPDPDRAVIGQKIGQANPFVADGGQEEDGRRANTAGAVCNRRKIAPLAESA